MTLKEKYQPVLTLGEQLKVTEGFWEEVEGKIKMGETLGKIAKLYYGKAGEHMRIFNANTNNLKNPDLIHPGQKLIIPNP